MFVSTNNFKNTNICLTFDTLYVNINVKGDSNDKRKGSYEKAKRYIRLY